MCYLGLRATRSDIGIYAAKLIGAAKQVAPAEPNPPSHVQSLNPKTLNPKP